MQRATCLWGGTPAASWAPTTTSTPPSGLCPPAAAGSCRWGCPPASLGPPPASGRSSSSPPAPCASGWPLSGLWSFTCLWIREKTQALRIYMHRKEGVYSLTPRCKEELRSSKSSCCEILPTWPNSPCQQQLAVNRGTLGAHVCKALCGARWNIKRKEAWDRREMAEEGNQFRDFCWHMKQALDINAMKLQNGWWRGL